jgi:hypothetical protein
VPCVEVVLSPRRWAFALSALGLGLLGACTNPPTPSAIREVQAPAVTQAAATQASREPAASMAEYRVRAARKIEQANPQLAFAGPLPDPLASIPVLLVHLNANGTVSRMDVLRTPRYFPHTVEMAKRAVQNAQPFGSVAHLPKPWQFSETFLFNDDLKFQLRTLVELTAEN